MVGKFNKGYAYIVSGDSSPKYLVQQTGLKSWRAIIFTHPITNSVDWKHAVLEGNSHTLYERLEERCTNIEVRKYSNPSTLRRGMFNMLKYGKFEGEE